MTRTWNRWAVALLVGFAVFGLSCHFVRRPKTAEFRASAMEHEPLTMLWAWETPEDLTTLDPSKAGVAFLSRELLLGTRVQVRMRKQPLRVPPNTWLMAVVRIETATDFIPDEETIGDTARAIAAVAQQPDVRAVQVDFDATRSQWPFYADVLKRLRPELAPNMLLSITALVSWCGEDSWLHRMPIDEAVPMFFRMGGPAAIRAIRPKDMGVVHEPLCSGSVGISTDETWPAIHDRQRVYVFHPGSWTEQDLARVNALAYHGLTGDSVQ